MAIEKNLEVKESGVFVEYWKITQLNINWHKKNAYMVIEGFKDKEARDDGKLPLISKSWSFTVNDFPFTIVGENVKEGYDYITSEIVPNDNEETKGTEGVFNGLPEV